MDENITEKLTEWVSLSLIFPAANSLLWAMLEMYGSTEDVLERIFHDNALKLPYDITKNATCFRKSYAEDIIAYCNRSGISVISYDSENYPEQFKNLYSPPAVIYCKGNPKNICSEKSAAIVGARRANDYSLKVADYFSSGLAEKNVLIVSGFANGIDTAAHMGAVKSGGKTVAVLGCGVDFDYPKGKAPIQRIIVEHGAVISEFPPLYEPAPNNFKIRNRLIAALSDKILVVQAGSRSGSLNTVSHGLEQGKDIYVVPPRDIFSKDYTGQSDLIRDGARPVCSPEEMLEDYE